MTGDKLFSRAFVLVCLIAFSYGVGVNLTTPTLPLYWKIIGGHDSQIGLILGVFVAAALVARPVTGRALDIFGRKPLVVAGAMVFFLAMALYNFASSPWLLLLLRLVNGFAFGIIQTAGSTLAADVAPASRRAEGLGYFGNSSIVAMALAPPTALWLISTSTSTITGFATLFVVGSFIGALPLLCSLLLRTPERAAGEPGGGRIDFAFRGLISRRALPVSFAALLVSAPCGTITAFAMVYLSQVSTASASIFFFVYAAAMAISRPLSGILADRLERTAVVVPSMALVTIGATLLFVSSGLPSAVASATFFGVGVGSVFPGLMALTVDIVKPKERGAALGTFLAAQDLGMVVGSAGLGLMVRAGGYPSVFLAAAALGALAVFYFLGYQRMWERQRDRAAPCG